MVVSIIPDCRDGHAILQSNIYVWDIGIQRKIGIFSDVIHVRCCLNLNSSILPTGDLELENCCFSAQKCKYPGALLRQVLFL